MCIDCKSKLYHLMHYLNLIGKLTDLKKDFEIEVHPNGLDKFRFAIDKINNELGELALNCVNIPKENVELRNFYLDCIDEHFHKNMITRIHLEQCLLTWKNGDFIKFSKQAD